jgi:hypothetical protein
MIRFTLQCEAGHGSSRSPTFTIRVNPEGVFPCIGRPHEIQMKGSVFTPNLMTSPRLSLLHLYPTRIIRFVDGVQKMIIWSQVLGVVVLSLRSLLAGP